MHFRDSFNSKIGYILAAAGSAVGLGNIWRFPYLSAKYGGGIFLFTYLVLVLTFGYTLLIAENGIGRMTGRGPIGAYRKLCKRKKSFLKSIRIGGYINSIVPLIITPYYCVIGGWITKYALAMATTPIADFQKDHQVITAAGKTVSFSENFFNTFITGTWEPLLFFLIFVALMVAVLVLGVKNGVERFNKILMPILIILMICICVYCLFLPNAGDGFVYYLKPDWSKFSYMTVVAAMGQLFFSLSIAMGIMITYGSYMRKEDNLVSCVNHIEIFDTAAAFLAGLMIIPAVVAFGGREAAENAGVGLVFITMPQVFAGFNGGTIFGVLFFILVLFAASTSAISILETNIQTISQEFMLSRKKAIAIAVAEVVAIGTITILGYSVWSDVHPLGFIAGCQHFDILDSLDFLSNSVLMPIGAIFTSILVVAVIGLEKFSKEIRGKHKWAREYVFQLFMCVFIIPCLLVILLNAIGILR